MATENKPVNPVVQSHGDHDRVTMLSLKADGVPDQLNPEIIGDKDVAIEAAKEQFKQQAVSAIDVEKRGATVSGGGEELEQDPSIKELQKAHDKAAGSAESAAEKTVNSLFKGE